MKQFWQAIKKIYQQKQGTLYSSTIAVSLTLLCARLLGVIKLRILTSFYRKEELDLFFAAFRFPDFIFEVLIAGSIASCFIPLISELTTSQSEKKAVMQFAQTLSWVLLFIWVLLLVITIPFFETITRVLLPGYSPAAVKLVSSMSLLILIFQVPLLLVANFAAAIFQTEKQFLIPGLAPIFYNVGIIVGVVSGAHRWGLQAAILGVLVGAASYLLILVPGLIFLGYPIIVAPAFRDVRLKRFFTLFLPRIFSSLVSQIDATVDLALSTLRGMGSYSSFYLAQNFQILPVSFFGIAISQTALPFFSDLYNQGKKERLLQVLVQIIQQVFFVMIPISVFFIVLRIPLIRLFFGSRKFDWEATVTTANILSLFALSLPFHTVYYIVTRVYFALHDTKTPFVAGVIFTLLNTALSIVAIVFLHLPVWYLAAAFSVSISLNVIVLFYILIRRYDHVSLPRLTAQLFVFAGIGFVTGVGVWLLRNLLDGLLFDTQRTLDLFFLTSTCVLFGYGIYMYLLWIFMPSQIRYLFELLSRLEFLKVPLSKYRKVIYTNILNLPIEEKM